MAIKLAGGTKPYILKDDRESENPTIFNINDLTAAQRGQLDDAFAALPPLPKEGEKENTSTTLGSIMRALDAAYLRACEIGVESVSGVLDAEGDPIELPARDVVSKLRDPKHVRELGVAVLDINRLSEEEEGNS